MAKNDLITCSSCGASVAKSAKTCPNCGANTKKPFTKTFNGKLLKYILILYIFIALDFTLNGRALPNFNTGTSTATEDNSNTETGTGTEENQTGAEQPETSPEEVADPTETTEAPSETPVQTQNINTNVESTTSVEQAPTTNQDGTVEPVKIGQ